MNENDLINLSKEERHEFQMAFGAYIKQLRKSKELSQEHIATKLNMSIDAVSSLERGKIFASSETLVKLARLHQMEVYELFTFADDKSETELLYMLFKTLKAQNPDTLKALNEQITLSLKHMKLGK